MPRKGQDRWFKPKHATVDIVKEDKDISDEELERLYQEGKFYYSDYSDHKALVDKMYIDFFDLETYNSIAFKAYITDWSDSYEAKYEEGNQMKNVDYDLKYFIGTRRNINFSWKTVAASYAEAKENMERCTELLKMAYGKKGGMPGIPDEKHEDSIDRGKGHGEDDEDIGGMNIKVRFANWLLDPGAAKSGAFDVADDTGLVCQITNMQWSPDLEEGSFDTYEGVFPKVCNLTISLTMAQQVGDDWKEFKRFPFGAGGLVTEFKGHPPTFKDMQDDDVAEAIELKLFDQHGILL
jgi:hypothetical protein